MDARSVERPTLLARQFDENGDRQRRRSTDSEPVRFRLQAGDKVMAVAQGLSSGGERSSDEGGTSRQ